MKLGIENLKNAVVAAINLAEKVEKNYSDDGKLSFAEALGIGASSFGDILKVIRSGNQIKQEFLDLDSEEKAELIELVNSELDLENDKLELIIERSIDFLVGLEELINIIRK